MATMTNEQIEQKKQLLIEKMKEMKGIHDELVEAGAVELSEEELDKAAGGNDPYKDVDWLRKLGEDAKKFDELSAIILQ